MNKRDLLKKLNRVKPTIKNKDSGQDLEKIEKKNTPTTRKPVLKKKEKVVESTDKKTPDQNENRQLTGKEKRDIIYQEIKKSYKLDLTEKYIVFEQVPTGKSKGSIPGLIYIPRRGYAIATYPDMAAAKKLVNKKRSALPPSQRFYDYKILTLSESLKTSIVKSLKL